MKQSDFLKDTNVIDFIDFLTGIVSIDFSSGNQRFFGSRCQGCGEGDSPCCGASHDKSCCWHCYLYLDINQHYCFSSILDATNQYHFPINQMFHHYLPVGADTHSISSNNIVLANLQRNLRASFLPGNDQSLLQSCIDILRWGGTEVPVPYNINYLTDVAASGGVDPLYNFLQRNIQFFSNAVLPVFPVACPPDFRSNAGFTKIYSLLVDDFTIYDARVAAALQALVVQYCLTRNLPSVPQTLKFRKMAGRPNHLRDGSTVPYVFQSTNNASHHHADSNIRANLILTALLARFGGKFGSYAGQAALRHLEAGLFMLGYDLKCDVHGLSGVGVVNPQHIPQIAGGAEPTRLARAIEIYRATPVAERMLGHIRQRFIDEIGMTHAGATTYFYNVRRIVNAEPTSDKLPAMNIPDWLSSITADQVKNENFPLEKILKDSFYYPCAGFDGDPVKHFGGNFFSFIYVDYGTDKERFLKELSDPGFYGYQLLAGRELVQQELAPNGWKPDVMPSRSDMVNRYPGSLVQKPFCYWSIFERSQAFDASHGPERFSLLYLCTDGTAAYQALYNANNIAPKAVAVIQPGHDIVRQRTNFQDPEKIFARSVFANSAGNPDFLVYGGIGRRKFYRTPCWPEQYGELLGYFDKCGEGSIGVWHKK